MAIILRKAGAAPIRVMPPSPPPAQDYKSPFRESYHKEPTAAEQAVESALNSPPVADPVKAKPKAVFKITPGRPVRPGLPTPSTSPPVDKSLPDAALLNAGLLDPPKELTSADLYPPVYPGDFITVTNTLFAAIVKHYQPGDVARVLYSSPTHSHPDDPIKYRAHFCEIVEGPRKGQKPMLFRYEFEPRATSAPSPKVEGRLITQT